MKKFMFLFSIFFVFFTSASFATSNLNSIVPTTWGNTTQIKINFDNSPAYTKGVLTYNNKIYLDFKDTKISQPLKLDINANNVLAVRMAQNQVTPSFITRVVFDMQKIGDYSIVENIDGKSIVVIFNGTGVISNGNINNTTLTSRGNVIRKTTNNSPLIVIDPGHGGKDPGAIFNSINEKDLNLDIAKRLYKLLNESGYRVVMTRDTDVYIPLSERAKIANDINADLFISIHNNSMPKNFSGIMTLYRTKDNESDLTSKALAEKVQKSLENKLQITSIGSRLRTNLAVLNLTKMPAVIAEVACMSDSSDLALLRTADFRQKAAEGIYEAVLGI